MPHRSRRLNRVDELLKQELARLISEEVKDPRVGFTTVMAVRVSADLRHARIYVSILGEEEEKRVAIEALQRAGGFLRGRLGSELTLKYLPELHFELDRTLERAARIETLLDQTRDEEPPSDQERGK